MALIVHNDHRAFEELHKRYHKRLLCFMVKMLNKDEEKARDLLHDLFLKLVERPYLFHPEKKFYTWVFTVAANMCRTEYRNRFRESFSTDDDEIAGKERNREELIGSTDALIFNEHLSKALDDLQYEHKETFILRFQEDFSLQEISEMMNCSVGTVKSRIYYTTRKLANELEAFKTLLKK